jgi:uncharacterized protein
MSDLTARIREVIGAARTPATSNSDLPRRRDEADRVLGGTFVERESGRCLIVDRSLRPSHYHGDVRLDTIEPADGCASVARLVARDDAGAPPSLLFVDLETTGLAGGAGTHAFLVGCGWFDGDAFRTRQFFLDRFEDEPAFLDVIAEQLSRAAVIASFNGKSFDLPLIETRYLFHRLGVPSAGKPHLDLLHPSRRLWRGPDGCSLAVLEQQLFGITREADVAGFEIPGRYFAYVRGAHADTLEPVLAHNRSDLLSLALIAVHVGRLLDRGAPAARSAEECCGLGQLYEWIGERTRAIACYERAARLAWRSPLRRLEALRAMARLYRRDRRHDAAFVAWEAIVEAASPSTMKIEAVTALAVHHEHRTRDLGAAKRFATLALEANSHWRRAAAEYRLARIERKLEHRHPQLSFSWAFD